MQTTSPDREREKRNPAALLLPWLLLSSTAVFGGTGLWERGAPSLRKPSCQAMRLAGTYNTAFLVLGDDGRIITSSDGLTWLRADETVAEGTQWQYPLRLAHGLGLTAEVGFGPIIQVSSEEGCRKTRPPGLAANLHGIAYGNGLFVAVGNEGVVVTSAYGIDWTVRNPGTEERLRGIAYGNGIFVAVGYAGTILASRNGLQWRSCRSGTDQRLLDVAYGNGQFVAIGWNGIVLTSENGLTWTHRASGVSAHLRRISFGPGNSGLANK